MSQSGHNEIFKNNKTISKNIVFIFYIVIVLFILAGLSIGKILYVYSAGVGTKALDLVEMIKCTLITLGMVASITCFLYYKNIKEESMFIQLLIYIIGTIDGAFLSSIVSVTDIYRIQPKIINIIIRLVLIAVIIIPESSKIKKKIYKNKKYISIGIITITVIMNLLSNRGIFLIETSNFKHIAICYGIIEIIFLTLLSLLMWIGIKEKKTSSTAIIISVSCNILCYLYSFILLWKPSTNLQHDIIQISIVGFIMINICLLLDYSIKINTKRQIDNRNKVFYKIINENQYNKIIICNKNLEPIYCNEIAKDYCKDIGSINVENEVEKSIDFISQEMKKEITTEIDKSGIWNGIIHLNSEQVLRGTVQKNSTDDNEVIYVFVFVDITNEYETRKALRRFGEKFNCIASNMKEIIVVINRDGYITYINNAVTNILEYEQEEIIGKNILRFTENLKGDIRESIDQSKGKVFEVDIRSKNGELIKLETTAGSIIIDDINHKEFIFVARDAKARQALESLKKKYYEMEQYRSIKSEFFANISHELRTPLNIIYSSIQLLDTKIDNDEEFIQWYKKYNSILKQNCFRTLKIANNIIDISKVESGHIKLEASNIDIISLLEETTLALVEFVESKRINLVFDTDIEELVISCDKEKIQKAILNILSNSIKYVEEEGNIKVKVKSDNKYVSIIVKDDGIGIPKELRDVVFNKFVQVDKGLSRAKEGTGIGLALVKSIAELHGGSVELATKCDTGCEIIFKIPNVAIENIEDEIEVTGVLDRTIKEQISIELSDIYDL